MAAAQYVMRIGDVELPILSSDALEKYLDEARERKYSDFWVVQRGTSMKAFERLLYRALGLRADNDGPSVYVLTSPEGAAVVFLDEDFNEQRVVNRDADHARGEIAFELSNGQTTMHPAEEVVPHDVAFRTVRYFFEHGKRPPSLTYRRGRGRNRRVPRK